MAKDIRTQYNEYLNNTAPDMDMLWSRIESRIDNTNDTEKTIEVNNITVSENNKIENTHEENSKQIKVSTFNTKRFAAIAAAFIVVVAGVTIMKNGGGLKTDTKSADNAPATIAAAKDDAAEEDTYGDGDSPITVGQAQQEEAPAADDAYGYEAQETQAMEEADDFLAPEADNKRLDDDRGKSAEYKNEIDDKTDGADMDDGTIPANDSLSFAITTGGNENVITIDDNISLTYDEFTRLTTPSIEYNELQLAESDTIGYQSLYIPADDFELTENEILKRTTYFADVKVTKAELDDNEAEYTLSVNEWYFADDSEKPEITEITLKSSTPYILQENREYLVALKKSEDDWKLTFDSAPQIQITLDGGYIFTTLWYHLYSENGSNRFLYPDYELGNATYQLMLYSDKANIEDLLNYWKLNRLNSDFEITDSDK